MSENKYNNSKIYLFKCTQDGNSIHVGSKTLDEGWNQHKGKYNIEHGKEYIYT
jgi:hypothetical protein